MEWLTAIRGALEYMEENLLTVESPEEVSAAVCISTMYLQQGFRIMTGFTLGEYVRNRRLYLAALDLTGKGEKIIDIAYKYGYETPESFTKAFSRFHGASPSEIRKGSGSIKTFLPLRINIQIKGGNTMEFKLIKKEAFKVIGFRREFSNDTSYKEVPKFWDEVFTERVKQLFFGAEPANAAERAIKENNVGEYGICIDDLGGNRFGYMIAGAYNGGEVPEGMTVFEVPAAEWAVFDCSGKMPESLQSVNTKIWSEWLPGNPDYELCGKASVEWYASDMIHSAIWIPVKRKS